MARLLRTTGVSRLRPPVVLNPSITFSPIRVLDGAAMRASERGQRGSGPRLRPPIVVTAASVFTAPPLRVTGVAIKAAQTRQLVRYRLQPPTTLAAPSSFIASPIGSTLAPSPARSRSLVRLRPPAVVAPSITFPPVSTSLAPGSTLGRRLSPRLNYTLRPPATLVAAAVFTPFAPLEVRLARYVRPGKPSFHLQAPSAVGASIVFTPLRVKLTAQPSPLTRRTRSELHPIPRFVAFVAPAIKVLLTRPSRKIQSAPRLRPPARVGASIVFRPVQRVLVRRPKQAGGAKSIVGKIIAGLALIVPSYWLEGDPAGSTFDGDSGAGTLDDRTGGSTMDGDQGGAGMDGRSGSSGM